MKDSMIKEVSPEFLSKLEKEMHDDASTTAPSSPAEDTSGTRTKKLMKTLEEALAHVDIPVRSGLAQKMEREMATADKEHYKKLSTKGKSDFRVEWAKNKLGECIRTQGRSKTHIWQHVDISKGTYLSFWANFKQQGGTEEDLQATKNIVSKCIAMGGPWVTWNSFSERWDYMYLERGMADEVTQKWKMFEDTA